MAQIQFDQRSKTWYRVYPDGRKEALGNGTQIYAYDMNSKSNQYQTLGSDGKLYRSTKKNYDLYQEATKPKTAKEAAKNWWSGISDAFASYNPYPVSPTVNPTKVKTQDFRNTSVDSLLTQTQAQKSSLEESAVQNRLKQKWKAENEAAQKRAIEAPKDYSELETPYLTNFLQIDNNGKAQLGSFNLSPEDRVLYEAKWGEKNKKVKEEYGLDAQTIYLQRMLTDVYGKNAAQKLFPDTEQYQKERNLSNWELAIQASGIQGYIDHPTSKYNVVLHIPNVSGEFKINQVEIQDKFPVDSDQVPKKLKKLAADKNNAYDTRNLLGWVKASDGKFYGMYGSKAWTEKGETKHAEGEGVNFELFKDLKEAILEGALEKYGKIAGEWQLSPKYRNANPNVGLSSTQNALTESLKNDRTSVQMGAQATNLVLNGLLGSDGINYILSSIGDDYKNEQGERALEFMEIASNYRGQQKLKELSEEERRLALARADFINSQTYANYKDHQNRIYGEVSDDPQKERERQDAILLDYITHGVKANYMGEEATESSLKELLQNKEAKGVSIGGWALQNLGAVGNGTIDLVGGLANFAFHYNPITLTAMLGSSVLGDGELTDSIIEHSLDNNWINWTSGVKTTGSWFYQDEKKKGKAYTNEELKAFFEANIIDEDTYNKAIAENAEIAAGLRDKHDTTLSYGVGGTSSFGVVNTKAAKSGADVLFNRGSLAEIINVAMMMAGTKGMGTVIEGLGGTAKAFGAGINQLGKLATRAPGLGNKLGGWGLRVSSAVPSYFGRFSTELAATASALALDQGYAKSAYDQSLQQAEQFVHSKDFNAKVAQFQKNNYHTQEDVNTLIAGGMSPEEANTWLNKLDLNKIPKEIQDLADAKMKQRANTIEALKQSTSVEDKQLLASLLQEGEYTYKQAVDDATREYVKNKYMQQAKQTAQTSAGITWALTGAVDVLSFNTLGKAMYGVGASKTAGAIEYLQQLPKKVSRKMGFTSAPALFKDFTATVGKDGSIKVAAEKVGRGFLAKQNLKSVLGGFISNYNQDLGVGAGDAIYTGIMDNYVENYFNPKHINDIKTSLDYMSLGTMLAYAESGAVESATKIESVRDGLYGGLAGFLISPRFDAKKRARHIKEAKASGVERSLIQKAYDLIPMSFDFAGIDLRKGENAQTKEINLERQSAAKAMETFLNSEKGKEFMQEFPQIQQSIDALDKSRASGDILVKKNAEGHALLSQAFMTAALEDTAYGQQVLQKTRGMVLDREYTAKDIDNLKEKKQRDLEQTSAGNTRKKANIFSKEEQKLLQFIPAIGQLHNTEDSQEIADRLNSMSKNAKEFLQMVNDSRNYMDKAAIVLQESNNYVTARAYAESMAYKNYLKRRYQEDINTYNQDLQKATERLDKEQKEDPSNSIYSVQSNLSYTGTMGVPEVLRVIHQSQSDIDLAVQEQKEQIKENEKRYKRALKDYRIAKKAFEKLDSSEHDSKKGETIVTNMVLASQAMRALDSFITQGNEKLKQLKQAQNIALIAQEVKVQDESKDTEQSTETKENEEDQVQETTVPFIISARDILTLNPRAQMELIQAYDRLDYKQQEQIDLASEMYANDDAVSQEQAREALLDNSRTIVKTKELEKATKQEIKDTLSHLEVLDFRINELAKSRAEIFFKDNYRDFASRPFASYEDFYKSYNEQVENIKGLSAHAQDNIVGLDAALRDANVQYFQDMQDRNKEVSNIHRTLDFLELPGIDTQVIDEFKTIIENQGVQHNVDLGTSKNAEEGADKKKDWEVISEKLENLVNNITVDQMNEILEPSTAIDQVAYDDRINYFRDILEAYKQANQIQEKKDEFQDKDVADEEDQKEEEDPAIQEERDQIITQEQLKTSFKDNSLEDFLKEVGFIDGYIQELVTPESEKTAEEVEAPIKEVIQKILNNEDADLGEIPPKMQPLVKGLISKIGSHTARMARNKELLRETKEKYTPTVTLFTGDDTSTDPVDQQMTNTLNSFRSNEFLTGRHIQALDISKGKIPVRLLSGRDPITGHQLSQNGYYAVAVEVPNAIGESESDTSKGRTVTVDGTHYQVIGFYKNDDINTENKDELHTVTKENSPYRVSINIRTKTSPDESITDPLPIPVTTRAEGGQPNFHFQITEASESADGKPHLKYYEGGANTMEQQKDSGMDVIVREIADTTKKGNTSDETVTLATTDKPQEFNSFTKSFSQALKTFISNNTSAKNINKAVANLNKSANSKETEVQKDGAAHFGMSTKAQYQESLMPSIYLANGWEYGIVKRNSEEGPKYQLVVKDTNTDNKYAIGEIDTKSWENADESVKEINAFIDDVLTNIGNNQDINGNTIETNMKLPVFKWNVSWSQFSQDNTSPHVQAAKINNIENYIKEGILLYRPNKTELVHIAVDQVATEQEILNKKKEAEKLKRKAVQDIASNREIENLQLGLPESVVDQSGVKELLEQCKKAVNKVVNTLSTYYKTVTETGGKFYATEQKAKEAFYRDSYQNNKGKTELLGLGAYFTREILGDQYVTAEDRQKQKNSDMSSAIFGLATDTFIRDFMEHRNKGTLDSFTYDPQGIYSTAFSEIEFNTLKDKISNTIKGLTTRVIDGKEVTTPVKILGHNIIVGSKNKNFRELDLLLVNEATGDLYNIDIKTYNADNLGSGVTSNWAEEYHFNENNKSSQKNPETGVWEQMPVRQAYAIEVVEQRRWLEHVLELQGYTQETMPKIQSYLMYIPITKTANRTGGSSRIESHAVTIQHNGKTITTQKIHRVLGQKRDTKKWNIFDARDSKGNPIPIQIFRDVAGMQMAEKLAPKRMQLFLDKADPQIGVEHPERVSVVSKNDTNKKNELAEGGAIDRTGHKKLKKTQSQVITEIKNAKTLEQLETVMNEAKKSGLDTTNAEIEKAYDEKVKELSESKNKKATIPSHFEAVEQQLEDKTKKWDEYFNDVTMIEKGTVYSTGTSVLDTLHPAINLMVNTGLLEGSIEDYIQDYKLYQDTFNQIQRVLKANNIETPKQLLEFVKNESDIKIPNIEATDVPLIELSSYTKVDKMEDHMGLESTAGGLGSTTIGKGSLTSDSRHLAPELGESPGVKVVETDKGTAVIWSTSSSLANRGGVYGVYFDKHLSEQESNRVKALIQKWVEVPNYTKKSDREILDRLPKEAEEFIRNNFAVINSLDGINENLSGLLGQEGKKFFNTKEEFDTYKEAVRRYYSPSGDAVYNNSSRKGMPTTASEIMPQIWEAVTSNSSVQPSISTIEVTRTNDTTGKTSKGTYTVSTKPDGSTTITHSGDAVYRQVSSEEAKALGITYDDLRLSFSKQEESITDLTQDIESKKSRLESAKLKLESYTATKNESKAKEYAETVAQLETEIEGLERGLQWERNKLEEARTNADSNLGFSIRGIEIDSDGNITIETDGNNLIGEKAKAVFDKVFPELTKNKDGEPKGPPTKKEVQEAKKKARTHSRKKAAYNPKVVLLGPFISLYSFAMTQGGDLLNQISDSLMDQLIHCM